MSAAFRFPSDTNSSHFQDAIDTIGVKHAPRTPLARPTSNPPSKAAPEIARAKELYDRCRRADD
jgi:hypothetical protein